MGSSAHPSGVIVGATENGSIHVWNAAKMIMEENDSHLLNLQKHTGNVGALDFNKFQVSALLLQIRLYNLQLHNAKSTAQLIGSSMHD